MSGSLEFMQALASEVSVWRLQEYIFISFFALYAYYVVTTMGEEVSVIHAQRWNRGKALYVVIRYGMLVYIALHLCRDYRNYFTISPVALAIFHTTARCFSVLASDFCLGLCLSALLGAKALSCVAILTLVCVRYGHLAPEPFLHSHLPSALPRPYPLLMPFAKSWQPFNIPEPASTLFKTLGYPCYAPSSTQWAEQTIAYRGRDIRAYVNLGVTTVLTLLGVVAIFKRYKCHGGQLVQVIRRDGGMYYLCLIGIRLVAAIIHTPTVLSVLAVNANPATLLSYMANDIIIPILAQRLLINMRKVDYMGSEPAASKLMFSPHVPGSEDDLEGDFE